MRMTFVYQRPFMILKESAWLLTQTPKRQAFFRRNLSGSTSICSNKNDEKDVDDKGIGKSIDGVAKGVDGAKEDYIDENPEIQQILRDLYSEPDSEVESKEGTVDQDEEPTILGSLSYQNFKAFDDSDSRIIYDIDEERHLGKMAFEQERKQAQTRFKGIDNSRGKQGVFELDHLVDLLRRENCSDICVIAVPASNNYVDQIVIGTCTSSRHLLAVSDFVKKVFKMKRNENEIVPGFEGRSKNSDWIAADLGNIALHLFLQETREHYDLESLWTLGPEFDEQCQPSEQSSEDIFYTSGALAGLAPAGSSKKSASHGAEEKNESLVKKVNKQKSAKR